MRSFPSCIPAKHTGILNASLYFFPSVISHPNAVVFRSKWEVWKDKRHEKEQSWWGCHLIHPNQEEPEGNSKRAHIYLHLARNTVRTSTSFVLAHLIHLMLQMFPGTARLRSQHGDKTTPLESWNDRDFGLVRYSAQHHLLQCQTNTETAPALKTPTVLHWLSHRIKATYMLLSVSDIVSASLDMLCCSLSLALVAGAMAYPVLT